MTPSEVEALNALADYGDLLDWRRHGLLTLDEFVIRIRDFVTRDGERVARVDHDQRCWGNCE